MNIFNEIPELEKIKLLFEKQKIVRSFTKKESKLLKLPKKEYIPLYKVEERFFLDKVDIFKFIDRIAAKYNLKTVEELNIFLDLPSKGNLTEEIIKRAVKNKGLIENVLSEGEKIKLKEMYLKKTTKNLIKDNNDADEAKRKAENTILSYINNVNTFVEIIESTKFFPKRKKRWLALKKEIEELLAQKTTHDSENYQALKNAYKKLLLLTEIISLGTVKSMKAKRKNSFLKEKADKLITDNKRKAEEYRLQQEQELLRKIEERKNANGSQNINSQKNSLVNIEAYLDDFDSEKSRLVLSVLKGENIKMSFYNGVVRFIDDKEVFIEIPFSTNDNIVSFSIKGYTLSLDIHSNLRIIDIFQKQTNNAELINYALNCLSVLYYINTFTKDKEKIEVSYQNEFSNFELKYTLAEQKNSSDKKVVYLNENGVKRVQTIKIKRGRQILGKSLTRGHWRRQPYADGSIKIIWIEPFYRGSGENRKQVYKINKN